MSTDNRVDELDIIKEIAKATNQTQEVVRGTIHAYQRIIERELQQGNTVTIKNFGSFSANYRKFSLISASGNPVTGGIVIKFGASRTTRERINSTEPIIYDTDFNSDSPEVIKNLKNEIRKLKLSNFHAKKSLGIVKKNCADRIKRIYSERAEKRVKAMSKVVKKNRIKREAGKKLNEKLIASRIRTTHYLDAITAYPVLTKFYKSQGLTVNELNMFIVVNHFKNFTLKDAKILGFKRVTAIRALAVLVDAGLVEKFEGRTKASGDSYASSLVGKKKFTAFAKTINKDFRTLLNEYSKVAEQDIEAIPIKSKL